MNEHMRPKASRESKAAVRAKTDELVADLQAIRAQVASKRSPDASLEELEGLQRRLFEVWVAEKLAQAECRQEQSIHELHSARHEMMEMRNELADLRKEVGRLGKVAEKLTSKLDSQKAARAGKGR